ncbi:MAG TPA: type II toxin-antitoxin system VapC family toxin [Candidatus Acidoferrum sp.]|nr:type II toxin-antitoxin system VapC family toxin [Candidatus Acidoferrum sp.]
MILLDTNVLSALMKGMPDVAVAKWLDLQPRESIWITSVNLMEVRFGLQTMPTGRKKAALTEGLTTLLDEKIQGRIALFDVAAAEQAAELMALRKAKGRPVDLLDTMIAGIALASRAMLATRNTSHFADLSVPVVNPWGG